MADNTAKYLLYASLLLGSIGTFHALKDGVTPALDSQVAVAGLLTNGDASSADLTELLTQLSSKVDENAKAKAANTSTIMSVAEDTTEIRSEVDELAISISAVDAFLLSFNNQSTNVHSKLAEIDATLATLTSFNSSEAGSPVEVDSAYVTNLSKRIDLLQTSLDSSSTSATLARADAETNKGSIASIKTSVDTLRTEFSSAKIASGEVAQVKEDLQSTSPSSASITAMTTRLNGLTTENQRLAERLVGLEGWREAKADDAKNLSSDSSAAEISESVLNRLVDVEIVADTNKLNVDSVRTDVDINTTDITDFQADLQEQISLNKSAIAAVELKADTTDDSLLDIWTPRVNAIEDDVKDLLAHDITVNTKLTALEEAGPIASTARQIIADNLVGVAERVTNAETAISGLEDDMEQVVTPAIDANKASIVAMVDDAAHLSEKLYRSGDVIICDGVLRTEEAQLSLNSNPINLGSSSSTDWMLWAGINAEMQSAAGYGFEGERMTLRVRDNSQSGFVLENSSAERLFSVRGNDGLGLLQGPLKVDGRVYLKSDNTNAYFMNIRNAPDNYALAHADDGITTLNSDRYIKFRVQEAERINVYSTSVKINNPGAMPTYFAASNNNICTGAGKKTTFRFGTEAASVHIENKEINIDGTNVLAKLNSLQAEVDEIKKDYVTKKEKIRLRNNVKQNDDNSRGYVGAHGWNIVCDKIRGDAASYFSILQP